jgi:Sulfatase.
MVPWFFRLLAMGLVLLLIPFVSDYFQKGTRGVSLHEGTDYIARYSLIGYQIADVASLLQEGQTVLAAEEKDEIAEWFKEKNREPRIDRDLSLYGFGKEKNLIVIQVESLQNFVIGREVNGQEITPNLNRLLKHSIYFPSFYPQTIEGNSSDAEFLTQVSLYPLEKGSVYYLYPDHRYFSLGEWMKSRGYRTVAIHADDASYWNRDDVYPNLGFDDYLSIDDFEVDEEIGMGLGDLSMFRQAAKFLSEMKEPFYSFLITLTNHTPFDLPEEYRKLNLQGELDESILGGYLQSVHYTDRAIGKFLEDLDRQGLLKNSVVAIYGDHDGIFEKEKGLVEKYLSHGEINDEEWIQTYVPVPLIIYNPGLEGEVIDKVGGQIDFLPTIGQIMGFNENMLYFSMGDNLFLSKKGAAIIPKGDYSQKPSYVVTDRGIRENLNEEEQKVLEISNLIIKGDYFREMEK